MARKWDKPELSKYINISNRGAAHGMSKLDESIVRKIYKLHSEGLYQKDIALKLGLNQSTICRILRGDRWKYYDRELEKKKEYGAEVKCISPSGEEFYTASLRQFALQHKLDPSVCYKVLRGKVYKHCKGWTFSFAPPHNN